MPDITRKSPLDALATLDVETHELKDATLCLLLAGKRFLTAVAKGARVSVEVGGDMPLRIHVRDKDQGDEEAA